MSSAFTSDRVNQALPPILPGLTDYRLRIVGMLHGDRIDIAGDIPDRPELTVADPRDPARGVAPGRADIAHLHSIEYPQRSWSGVFLPSAPSIRPAGTSQAVSSLGGPLPWARA